MTRLFLVDGSGYLYRAFYGVRTLARRDGFATNAIYGFYKMLQGLVAMHQPDAMAMVFDAGGKTFRHALYPAYKANRQAMPEALRAQIPIIEQVVAAFNIPTLRQEGFEADDLIGTLARLGAAAGFAVSIVSGDKDLMQMVDGERVRMFDPGKERWLGVPEVEAHWGVKPAQVIDLMGLAGDSSDNIPGVPGIGPKTAAQLLREFGDLDTLLAQPERIKQVKRRESVMQFAGQARLSRQLATIDCHVPLALSSLEALRCQPPDRARLRQICIEMEFRSLLRELDAPSPVGGTEVAAAVDPAPAPTPTPIAPTPAAEVEAEAEAEAVNDYRTITDADAFAAFIAELRAQPCFAIDTETTHLEAVRAELVGISISWHYRRAVYIPVAHTAAAAPAGQLERRHVLLTLKPLLEDPRIGKVGQNLKYDWVIFANHGIRLAGIRDDAMVQSHLLYGSERRHNLDTIAHNLLGRETTPFSALVGPKLAAKRFDEVPLAQAAPYACEDAELAWEATRRLNAELAAQPELNRLYREVEVPLVPVLAAMERAGAVIDRELLARMSADLAERREALVVELHRLAGGPFNVNSTQQLGEILFSPEKLGIKGGKRTKTGYSTDVTVLSRLADQGQVLPMRMLEYRTLTKLQSTYTDALLACADPQSGRVHTSFNQAVTLTGRLSSSDPNLQNIPVRTPEGRAIRSAFIAPPGWVLLAADYSQIELRLLAHMGNVPRLQAAFAGEQDIHAATAAELFGVDPDRVSSDQRRMAKSINFGLIYGMSSYGLARHLGIGNGEARAYMDLYFSRYAGVREYMQGVIHGARERGYVTTLGGRRCWIRDIASGNRTLRELAERTAINAPIQGSAADLIKMAMIRLDAALRQGGYRARMILQVHDELILEVPEEELLVIEPLVRMVMEGVMVLNVPLRVDIGRGRNWAEAH
ncbi:MAG: DNA polymerase I [Magnetococcales bacterium]|nr:DNA polymerase I [Magnetococcales bacterium]